MAPADNTKANTATTTDNQGGSSSDGLIGGQKPHSAAGGSHNQAVADPVAHFEAIPWCRALLRGDRPGAVIGEVVVPDRTPLDSGESNFVRRTCNSPSAVNACVTWFRTTAPVPASPEEVERSSRSSKKEKNAGGDEVEYFERKGKMYRPVSRSKALLEGGGEANGEDPRNPFILCNALLELGPGLQSYVGTMHGGMYGVLMDEVMGTITNFQAPYGAYTVSFTVNYRIAVKLPQVVVVRARVTKKDGRKLYVAGSIEDKDGRIMAEGKGLWLAMSKNVGRSQL